jgi:hypothetical protein
MSQGKREERLVLIGLVGLFLAVGLMLLVVSVFGGGLAED